MASVDDIDYSLLTIQELQDMLVRSTAELKERAIAEEDPEQLIQEVLRVTNVARTATATSPMLITPNVLALTGIVRDVGKSRHRCSLYTVKIPDVVESWWSWDEEAPTFIHSESTKVGGIRYTVSLHTAVSDMRVTMHTRSFSGGMHEGKSAKTYGLEMDGDSMTIRGIPGIEVGKLPLPTDMEE